MENLIKGVLFTVLVFVISSIILIICIPWLWNWIAFIWTSPLPAGQATRLYIWESFEVCAPFILFSILGGIGIQTLINPNQENELNEINLFPESTVISKREFEQKFIDSPTLSQSELKQSENGSTFKIGDIIPESRGVVKHRPGSQEAIDAWNKSEDRKRLQERQAELERQIDIEEAKVK